MSTHGMTAHGMTQQVTTPAIEIDGLVKEYDGRRVLDGVTLRVPAGSVFGFLGRNGAGKTTTLRILLGLAPATHGRVSLLGTEIGRATDPGTLARVGFVPDVPVFYPWMTAREYLQFVGRIFRLPRTVLDERIATLLDLADLTDVGQRIGGYSRGMRQRLGIIQGLVNAPDVLLLDEPTSALDPLGRKDVLDLIAALRGRTTVLFSTHILDDAQRVCDEVAVIESGRTLVQAPLADLLARTGTAETLTVQVSERTEEVRAALTAQPWVTGVSSRRTDTDTDTDPELLVSVTDLAAAQHTLPQLLAGLGVGLVRFDRAAPSLERVFVDLVEAQR